VAGLTLDPDAHFAELRARYATDDLRVPPVVFNAVLQKPDRIQL
jgi:hypothetical protein